MAGPLPLADHSDNTLQFDIRRHPFSTTTAILHLTTVDRWYLTSDPTSGKNLLLLGTLGNVKGPVSFRRGNGRDRAKCWMVPSAAAYHFM